MVGSSSCFGPEAPEKEPGGDMLRRLPKGQDVIRRLKLSISPEVHRHVTSEVTAQPRLSGSRGQAPGGKLQELADGQVLVERGHR